jgi:hypothetical protein
VAGKVGLENLEDDCLTYFMVNGLPLPQYRRRQAVSAWINADLRDDNAELVQAYF